MARRAVERARAPGPVRPGAPRSAPRPVPEPVPPEPPNFTKSGPPSAPPSRRLRARCPPPSAQPPQAPFAPPGPWTPPPNPDATAVPAVDRTAGGGGYAPPGRGRLRTPPPGLPGHPQTPGPQRHASPAAAAVATGRPGYPPAPHHAGRPAPPVGAQAVADPGAGRRRCARARYHARRSSSPAAAVAAAPRRPVEQQPDRGAKDPNRTRSAEEIDALTRAAALQTADVPGATLDSSDEPPGLLCRAGSRSRTSRTAVARPATTSRTDNSNYTDERVSVSPGPHPGDLVLRAAEEPAASCKNYTDSGSR